MVYVKTLRRKTSVGMMSYQYWAENTKKDGKVNVKLIRRLTVPESLELAKILSVELQKDEKKWALNALFSGVQEGRDKSRDTKLPANGGDQVILITIKRWMEDIETGILPNKPTQRPKAFIKNVLRPLIEGN